MASFSLSIVWGGFDSHRFPLPLIVVFDKSYATLREDRFA